MTLYDKKYNRIRAELESYYYVNGKVEELRIKKKGFIKKKEVYVNEWGVEYLEREVKRLIISDVKLLDKKSYVSKINGLYTEGYLLSYNDVVFLMVVTEHGHIYRWGCDYSSCDPLWYSLIYK